jgi:photosystem II stability/assembly factor-like uncharacterized protein
MKNAKKACLIALAALAPILAGLPAQAQGAWVKKYDTKRVAEMLVVSRQLLVAAAEDSVVVSPDSGATWHVLLAEPNAQLRDVFLFDVKTGWAVGHPGVVLQLKPRTGETTTGAGRLQGVGETDFYSVFFRDPSTGWIGGAGGRLMSTQDGGLTWSTQTFQVSQGNAGAESAVQDILFLTAQNGVAILGGKSLVYSEDGGKVWKSLGFPANVTLDSLTYSGQTLWLAGGRRLTPTLTVAMLWRSDDFGKTWNNVPVGDLYGAVTGVWFADASTGFIAVKGKVYETKDGGATWTEKSDGTVAIEKVFGADAQTLWGIGGGAIYQFTLGAAPAPAPPASSAER